MRRSKRYARELDGLTGSHRGAATRVGDAGGDAAARRFAGDRERRRATSDRCRRQQVPKGWRHTVAAGHHRRTARHAARARRLLRAGGPLSAALVAADDGDSGAGGGRARSDRVLSRGRMPRCLPRRSKPASIGCSRSAARTRSPRWPTARAPCRAWTRSSGRAIAGCRRPSRSSRPTAASTSTPGPTEILIVTASGPRAWIAADLLAQAEHDPDARAVLITPNRRLAERVAREVERQMPATGPRAAIDRASRRHHRRAGA